MLTLILLAIGCIGPYLPYLFGVTYRSSYSPVMISNPLPTLDQLGDGRFQHSTILTVLLIAAAVAVLINVPAMRRGLAEVVFADGKEMVFEYPSMQKLSVFERYFKERYRKFVENSHGDRYAYKWPAVAQSIAFQSYQGDGNMPVKVTLRRHFKEIKPLKTFAPPADYKDPPYLTYPYFTYMVDTDAIKRQAH